MNLHTPLARAAAAVAVPLVAAVALAGCTKTTGTHAAAVQSAKARASAAATSTTTKQDEAAAAKLAAKCTPANQANLLTPTGLKAFADCEKIPKGQARTDAEDCALADAEHITKAVPATPGETTKARHAAERHTLGLELATCAQNAKKQGAGK